jgi:hypothetical protein
MVMAERTARFPSVAATVLEAVEEAAAWSQRRRRSGTPCFPGTAVRAGRMARFPGAATAWRQPGWRQCGLDDVKECVGIFGSLTASISKSSG